MNIHPKVELPMIDLPQPYLLFLGNVSDPAYAKTAFGLRDWAPERCLGEYALSEATQTTGLPPMSPCEAYRRGARALVIGVASQGGQILESWIPALTDGLEAGLDIVSGMHSSLEGAPALKAAVLRTGRRFIEVRRPPPNIPIATGRKRSGKRILTVGADCALGKKYTALALAKAFNSQGVGADFRASGQTGIMIAGRGIPMDAVVSDFAAGAAEILSPDAPHDHWDVIEGQGSLYHPAYAGVSLALLHGSQPDVIVFCHEPGRTAIKGYSSYKIPSLKAAIDLNLNMGALTNPKVRCGGISLNTANLPEDAAAQLIKETAAALGLPVADPIRGGPAFQRLVEGCLG